MKVFRGGTRIIFLKIVTIKLLSNEFPLELIDILKRI